MKKNESNSAETPSLRNYHCPMNEIVDPVLDAAGETNDPEIVTIPSWDSLQSSYGVKWQEEKDKFHRQLRDNFQGLTAQFRSGKQQIFELTVGPYAKHYERAFRELFADTGYQATVGEAERLGTGTKKVKKLFISLPECPR